jgi:vitamin B12 transporter
MLKPRPRLLPAVFLSLVAIPASAADRPPYSEKIVVTATAVPEDESEVGSASTVITRKRIEETGASTVLDALRLVPGLDVVHAGADGAVASVFLRGSGSAQALVLVDGARVNSPYFGGFDFSSLSTANVERIEVVRGPFSSLYGSDAIGGVIQIFTRPPAAAPGLSAALEAGNAGARSGRLFATLGGRDLGVAISAGDVRVEGERPNADWRARSGSIRAGFRPASRLTASIEAEVRSADGGVPGPVGAETPLARGGLREQRISVPGTWTHADGRETSWLIARTRSEPTYRDSGQGFSDESDARTLQLRAAETWRSHRGTTVAFASWERWEVSSTTSFGPALDGDRTRIWAGGVEESIRFGPSWSATGGIRYDRHSTFGGEWSPRATIARLSSDSRWKVRASVGRAFRAPSIGELYYPYSSNPALKPERSASFEAGVERYLANGGRIEVSAFRSDFRDLILYDFAASRNENVGRARARGIELAARAPVGSFLSIDVGHTLLDAESISAKGNAPLPRRPRHRSYLAAVFRPRKDLLATLRATWVGRRPDIDALPPYPATTSPSYLRLDAFTRWDLGRYSPFVRLDNLASRRYEEADGYPAPGRRVLFGLDVRM